ncbi:MAG TPA: alcohol dehydrogenase catalytic domain-containing protein [Ktedonobacteraceae bacterium]|nr:alcohol dehydrogenase catalytic domain-containing protein [Ktedonobacteraceae bacterium]
MWTSTLELDAAHVIPTQLLGRFWHGAYFSSFAPLQVRNLPRHALPDTHWVRVRNILAGICGSDLHLVFVDGDLRVAPAALDSQVRTYPGHEVLGEVIEVGDEVSHVRVGDRVVLQHGPNCATAGVQPLCRSCAAGNYMLCEHGSLPGPQPIGGGWSEEMLLHELQLFRVPQALNDEQAVLLEPTSVAVHAVLRHLPQAGERVLVVGAGTIGLLIVQAVRALAPQAEISVVARHAFQVEQATRMGAAHIIYPRDSYAGVQRITGAELHRGKLGNRMLLGGFDVIYDTIGNRRTTHDVLRWTRAGGTVVMVGVNLHLMHIDLTPVWFQEIQLVGTIGHGEETWPVGSNEHQSTFAIAAQLIEQGVLRPEQLLTHRFALTNYREALQTATRKSQSRALKVVFDYSLLPPSVVPNVHASRPRRQPATTASSAQPPADELIDAYAMGNDFEEIEEPAVPSARQSHTPEPIVMPKIPPAPPTPLSPVLSDMVPPPMLNDDNEKTVVVSLPLPTSNALPLPTSNTEPGQQQPAPDNFEEDTQTTIPAIPIVPAPVEPVPAGEQEDDATTTFVAPFAPKAKRSRQKRAKTTGTIATAPVEDEIKMTPAAPALPDDLSAAQDEDEHLPFSTSSSWMDTLQAHQETPDDIPQWLSSLHMINQKTEAPEPVEVAEIDETDLQPPVTGNEKSSVTNGTSGTFLPVEEASVDNEHQSSPIQSKDAQETSQDE